MKITIECPEGYKRTIDGVGDVRRGPLRFNSTDEFRAYMRTRFNGKQEGQHYEVILEGKDGRPVEAATTMTRLDVWNRDFTKKTFLINKPVYLVDDDSGQTFDIIRPPEIRRRKRTLQPA